MARSRIDPPTATEEDARAQRWNEFVEAWETLTAEIAKLTPDELQRLERELNEAVDSAIRRRVEYLDREAAAEADPCVWSWMPTSS